MASASTANRAGRRREHLDAMFGTMREERRVYSNQLSCLYMLIWPY
jgi:hypothetical protein